MPELLWQQMSSSTFTSLEDLIRFFIQFRVVVKKKKKKLGLFVSVSCDDSQYAYRDRCVFSVSRVFQVGYWSRTKVNSDDDKEMNLAHTGIELSLTTINNISSDTLGRTTKKFGYPRTQQMTPSIKPALW